MKRTLAIVVPILILTATAWYFCLYASPLEISPETTYITAPLMSDGKRIDYFRAWEERAYPPEMKTDDNGYRILVRAIGDLSTYSAFGRNILTQRDLDPEPFRVQVYEKLGLDPTTPPTLKLESAWTFLERYLNERPEEARQMRQRLGRPWTFEDLPMLEDWLAENEAGIDLLSEAVRKPVFFAPMVRKSEDEPLVTRGAGNAFREFARALQARAMYHIGVGDINGAIDDVITIHLLARHAGKHGALVDCLLGIAFEGAAFSIPIGGNLLAPPSREQLQRLFDTIRSLPPLPALEDLVIAERLFALATLQEYAFGRNVEVFGLPRPGFWSFGVDWNFVFREVNDAFNALIAGEEIAEPVSMVDGEGMLFGREPRLPVRLTVRGRTEVARDVFISLFFFPTVEAVREQERRRQCVENMKLLTLALLLYEKDHGTLPDGDWREAIRPYLGENADKYFRCPSHPGLAEDETTYAMIRRESGVTPNTPHTLSLVEVFPPMKMTGNDGTILESQAIINRTDDWRQPTEGLSSHHPGGFNVSYRSGAIAIVSDSVSTDKLQSLIDGTADAPP